MHHAIRVMGVAGREVIPGSPSGKWVVSINPDAHNGLGDAVLTEDANEARQFETFEDAVAYWRAQSTVMPLRPDGGENRPGTAYSVEIVRFP
jgi:hypothetical protein